MSKMDYCDAEYARRAAIRAIERQVFAASNYRYRLTPNAQPIDKLAFAADDLMRRFLL